MTLYPSTGWEKWKTADEQHAKNSYMGGMDHSGL
jgi:hypothetical protein